MGQAADRNDKKDEPHKMTIKEKKELGQMKVRQLDEKKGKQKKDSKRAEEYSKKSFVSEQ